MIALKAISLHTFGIQVVFRVRMAEEIIIETPAFMKARLLNAAAVAWVAVKEPKLSYHNGFRV